MIQTIDIGKTIGNTIILTVVGIIAVKGYGKLMYLKGREDEREGN